jgi:predicted nucleic acid-binding protein
MRVVFADTSLYQALFNKRDRCHVVAAELLEGIEATIVTTDYVLLELGALMSRGEARPLYIRFVERVRSDPFTRLIPASAELLNQGLALFASRPDKEWSITDCISFSLMDRESISGALTCDRHFEQAGFHLLMQG